MFRLSLVPPRLPLLLLALGLVGSLMALLLLAPPAWAAWSWPLRGEVITPYSNGDDPYAPGQHRGIDIAGEPGAPVVAAAAGVVRFAGAVGSSGLTVSIRTEDGRFDTSYLHLSVTAVRAGEQVAAGQTVGAVGTTGVRSAEQPHLHFGVRDAGSRHAYQDPLALLPPAPGSPERPRGAPSPTPVPVPLMPAPEPVRRPVERRTPEPRSMPRPHHAPAPEHVPAGRRRPARRPVPVSNQAPKPRQTPVPHHAPVSHRGPAPDRLRRPATRRIPTGHGAPAARPAATTAASSSLADPGSQGRTGADGARAISPTGRGPDVGWVLACIGLLAAAAVLGLSEDGRRASRRGRRQLAALLSPLLGGR